ncbi:MAG: 50S ribosomal protein L11 methyltransferase [Phycisphaerales bacterium]|nr:MAG: 50S ribosomal protein L11 methyltransferase [Phycisphaerales bacterium]
METVRYYRRCVLVALMSFVMFAGSVQAAPAGKAVAGDWQVKVDFEDRQMTSILSISVDKDGKPSGRWISFRGISELRDVKYEDDKLSFTQVSRFRDQERTASFAGAIEKGKLVGVLSSDRGQSKAEGLRLRRKPPAVGSWDMKLKVGEREFTAVLAVKADEKRRLSAEWQSEWGEHQITDMKFKKGKLTFTRKSKAGEREWESSFEGTVKGHKLSGKFTSDRGDVTAEASRIGSALVGYWELEITSDSGSRKQMLRVDGDLSGMYGPIGVERVGLDDDQVTFKAVAEFGDRKFETSFAGKLEGRKLTGELTSSRGVRKVVGRRIGSMWPRQASVRLKKPSRKPDVIFVPTPEEVVEKMLELAEVKKDDLVYDLGCGDGRIVVTAAKKYGCRGVGYDIDPKRVRESLENVRKNNVEDLVRIEQKDIFTLDLSDANVITLYLLPRLNVKLIPQLEKLKDGSRIVSHDFNMKGVKPEKVVKVKGDDGFGGHTVYLWRTPLQREDVSEE